MAILLPQGKQQYFTAAGVPLVGGRLWTLDAGTVPFSFPRTTYQDAAGTIPNANPIILDARGEATIYWAGSYKVVLQDALGATIWTQDNVSSISGANSVLDNYSIDSGAANAYVVAAATPMTAYVAGLRVAVKVINTNTAASTLNYMGLGVRNITLDGHALSGGEIQTSGVYTLEYDGTVFHLLNATDPAKVRTAAEIAAAVVPSNYSFFPGDARRYGALGNNVANDFAALSSWLLVGAQGTLLRLPFGTYRVSAGLRSTVPVSIIADPGTRLRLTVAAAYVIELDYRGGGGTGWGYGGSISGGLVIDGAGFATDGLSLRGVISASFDDVRVTNVTRAGLHLWWAQLCELENFTCSGNVEAFTTTPQYGVLIDTASCSANVFTNATIEKVSDAGIRGISMVNTLWLNGTSEGNGGPGFDLGEVVAGPLTCIGNVVVGMDLEVNGVSDIRLRTTASNNTFTGVQAGFGSPAVLFEGADFNTFIGGVTGGFNFDASSLQNHVFATRIIGAGRGIVDAGGSNSYQGVYNITDGVPVVNKALRARANFVLAATGSVAIDSSTTSYAAVTFVGAGVSVITFDAPLRSGDANDLQICVHVGGAGALTFAFAGGVGGFKQAGITVPANGFNRTYTFRYDPNFGFWYLASQTAVDVPN